MEHYNWRITGKCVNQGVWCTITAYTITYSKYFLYKWSTRLQSMHNHMVGRTASVVSPLYSILLGVNNPFNTLYWPEEGIDLFFKIFLFLLRYPGFGGEIGIFSPMVFLHLQQTVGSRFYTRRDHSTGFSRYTQIY